MTADIRGSAWTLEPWGDRMRVIGPNDEQIADIWAPNDEQRANARLIAAAPEMAQLVRKIADAPNGEVLARTTDLNAMVDYCRDLLARLQEPR